jgi:integrase
MPSFRKAHKQARKVIKKHRAIGQSKHHSNDKNKIYSIGTARSYEQSLTGFAKWLKINRLGDLFNINEKIAIQYQEIRAQQVKQKTLDQERQAIQMCLGKKLPVIKSELQEALKSRAYTKQQIQLISQSQTAKNQLATKIAYAAGLRAHELFSLRKAKEQPKSKHRTWSKERFINREGKLYTVIGKGGLIREILIPNDLAEQLENQRLNQPVKIQDRKVYYQQYYNIAGGKNWTNSFSAASKRLFGWSHGAHGLRHSYAQERMEELQQRGFVYKDALETVSQELGHFRPEITEVYLR